MSDNIFVPSMAPAIQKISVPAFMNILSVRNAPSGAANRIMIFIMNTNAPMANRPAAVCAADLFPSKWFISFSLIFPFIFKKRPLLSHITAVSMAARTGLYLIFPRVLTHSAF